VRLNPDLDTDEKQLNANESRGLDLRLSNGVASREICQKIRSQSQNDDVMTAIDHVVINTNDADGMIDLLGEEGLGIRLALDQVVERWGGRMLFFRTGGLTIEVIQGLIKEGDTPKPDNFWGMTFRTKDLNSAHKRLSQAQVILSDVRTGRKPGTIVSSPKSHDLGIPTLLLGISPSE
jgi:hypothetical protein